MINLIVNADDFGLSQIFNEVILDLIKKRKILSTTVMVNRITDIQLSQIEELKALNSPNLSIGLHLEIELGKDFLEQVKEQYDLFVDIFGFSPSHIDVHKWQFPQAYPIIDSFCVKNRIPCRKLPKYDMTSKTTLEVLSASSKSFDEISNWLSNLKDDNFYEILFHPGRYDKDCKSSLNKKREEDITKINELIDFISDKDFKLCSFHDLNGILF